MSLALRAVLTTVSAIDLTSAFSLSRLLMLGASSPRADAATRHRIARPPNSFLMLDTPLTRGTNHSLAVELLDQGIDLFAAVGHVVVVAVLDAQHLPGVLVL